MRLQAEIVNRDKLEKRLEGLPDSVAEKLKDAIVDSVLKVHETAIKSIAAKSSGSKIVIRYSGGHKREQLVSAPGHPPNSDTGKLIQNIQFEIDELTGLVGTNLQYGAFLEFGTSKMKARPWLFPALEQNRSFIAGRIKEALKDGLK